MFHNIFYMLSKLICFVVSADDSDLSSTGSCGSYTESGVDPMVSSVRACLHVFLISHGGMLFAVFLIMKTLFFGQFRRCLIL